MSGIFCRCGLTASARRNASSAQLLLAEFLHDHAEAGERAEMARLARQHLADVGERPAVIFVHEVERGAPVPGLDIVGLELDDGVEQLDREIEIPCPRPRS